MTITQSHRVIDNWETTKQRRWDTFWLSWRCPKWRKNMTHTLAGWYCACLWCGILCCAMKIACTFLDNRSYVTWSREMSPLSKISIPIFLHQFLLTSKCFILMQTPLQLDIWLQSYEEFDNAKNSIKQRNWNAVFVNISKPISPTSDSFLLIMSHIWLSPLICSHKSLLFL